MFDRLQHSADTSLGLTRRHEAEGARRRETLCGRARCYVYIVRCRDETFYTGWTNDLEKRMKVHNEGRGGRYTRARLPVKLVHWEEFPSKNEAMSRERAIKKMTRAAKRFLIENAIKNAHVEDS